jgi:cyclopropane-fatty-acyl-phospholipid synthase
MATLIAELLGDELPVRVTAWDGSTLGPVDAPATVTLRSPDLLRRVITARGELGFARAYVAGDIDVDGDIFAALALRERLPEIKLRPRQLARAARIAGPRGLRPPPPPPEEARLRGRSHTRWRDAAAVSHHYDVGNAFYEMVLGPSLTYSCAVFERPETTLEDAQSAKYELICRKLDLRPGARLLDIGCGWGGMVLHAARHHGVHAVGVTLSREQQMLAKQRVVDAGLDDLVEIRFQDYRDIADGPFDAVSSIGMFEHVGRERAPEYFSGIHALLRDGGRMLNHAISRPPGERARLDPRGFVARYVFPDGELVEVGEVVTMVQAAGFEVRHVESLREHYARTLRCWVANLERQWESAIAEVGEARARIWRLYMAGSALNFEANRTQVHQVLGVRTGADGCSGLPPRPDWDEAPLV